MNTACALYVKEILSLLCLGGDVIYQYQLLKGSDTG